MVWPTCGPRRSSACSASGVPLKLCSPLSTPPMRDPRPPASTRPVMSSAVMCIGFLLRRLACASAPDVAHLHAPGTGRCAVIRCALAAQFGISVGTALPDVRDGRRNVLVAGLLLAQQRPQVVAAMGEQAQVQPALGGQAR